jgi:3-oxoacyl-[acyl-carrier-protein] synthase-1
MEEFHLIPQTALKHKNIEHVLSNSFGFGGNCSTVIFSKADEDLYQRNRMRFYATHF